jgi:urease accessory protein
MLSPCGFTVMHLVQRLVAERSTRPESAQVALVAERVLFLKRRWRGVAEDGTEFGFDLETRLCDGGVIYQTKAIDYVVRQQPELVYQIDIASPDFGALAGWKIGNLHLPVQIVDGCIRVLHDAAAWQLFQRESWPVQEVTVVFNPLRVAAHAS